MICGCDTIVEVQKYGLNKFDFLKTFLDLDNGIPSHDTIGRVFSLLDPQQFRACFATWVESLAQSVTGRVIAIDGKTLRRSHEKDQSPLHGVTAFAIENRLVLSQQATDAKSNEITAIPELLQLLNVKKAIITIDAMGCQKEIAAQIKAQGGHYVLGLKGNQPNLHEDVQELFQAGLESDFKDMDQQQHTTEEKSHGRIEKRTYHMLRPSAEWLLNHPEWIGLKTLGMVLSERPVEGKNETSDIRYFISSLPLNVKVLANAVDHRPRAHELQPVWRCVCR
jgi:predicted transposase YbfD/YdcC